MKIFAALAFCCAMAAQSFAPPLAGLLPDRDGRPQRIFGIAGNLLPEAPGIERVLGLAFTGSAGIVKSETSVVLLDASGAEISRFDAPGSRAVFGFDPSGRPALVWFSKTQELFAISASGLRPLSSPGKHVAALALESGGDVQVVNDGPALLLPTGLLTASGVNLTLRYPDGSEDTAATPATVEHLERMGDGWAAIQAGGQRYALRLSTPMRIYRIPEAAQ